MKVLHPIVPSGRKRYNVSRISVCTSTYIFDTVLISVFLAERREELLNHLEGKPDSTVDRFVLLYIIVLPIFRNQIREMGM